VLRSAFGLQPHLEPECFDVWIGLDSPADPNRLISGPRTQGDGAGRNMSMIQNRELTMDDYLSMLRRRAKVILIPALVAPLVGFLVSFAFTPKYTSQSLILVEGQKVPESMVQPVVSEDLKS